MATIRKRQRKTGEVSYQAIIRRGTVTETKTFATKAKANAWAREVEGKIDQYAYRDLSSYKQTTCSDIFKRYLEEVAPTKKSKRFLVVRLNRLLATAAWVKLSVVHVHPDHLRAWRDKRLTEVSAGTVDRELNDISAVFSWMIKELGIRIANPVFEVARPKNADKARTRTYEWHEVKTLLRAMKYSRAEPLTGRAQAPYIFLIALRTAMRLSEVCSVTSDMLGDRCIHLVDTKNGDDRDVPLSRKAERLLVRAMGSRYALTKASPDAIGMYFRQARNTTGLDVRFHDTRHSAITTMAEKVTNVLELAAISGHRSTTMLKRYYNPKAKTLAEKLD